MMSMLSGHDGVRAGSGPSAAWRDRKAPPPEGPCADADAVFMDVALEVGPGVVTPRLETELLVQEALTRMEAEPGIRTVLDLCCGCGAIALALATRNADIRIRASDLLEAAAAVTRRNVLRHGLGDRVTVSCGDLFSAFDGQGLEGRVDLIVANPPYISTGRLDSEKAQLLEQEPREAFDGGPYGLAIHQRLIREAPDFLVPGGWLLFEFGHGQERQVAALIARRRGFEPAVFACDQNGAPRVAAARWRGGHAAG